MVISQLVSDFVTFIELMTGFRDIEFIRDMLEMITEFDLDATKCWWWSDHILPCTSILAVEVCRPPEHWPPRYSPLPHHLLTPPLLDFPPIFPETSIAFHLQALTHRVFLELATSKKSTAILVCSIIYIRQHKTLSFPCCGWLFGFLLLILMRKPSLFGLLHNFWMEETNTNGGA